MVQQQPLSYGGACWVKQELDKASYAKCQYFAEQYDIDEKLICLLWQRGVISHHSSQEDFDAFLNPQLRYHLPDPLLLHDMDKAVKIIHQYLDNHGTIGLFGDYDVDGTSSCALLTRYFTQLQQHVICQLPHRFHDGYGPNQHALEKLYHAGVRLLILVDCGTTAIDILNNFREKYPDCYIIILDHHQQSDELPNVDAIINPNRLDYFNPTLQYCCTGGIAFLLLVACNRYLRQQRYFQQKNITEPYILPLLSYVVMATICDIVPLLGINRLFVKQGLSLLQQMPYPCFQALSEVSALESAIDEQHIAFQFGPRINAAGRIADPIIAYNLFMSDDDNNALSLANECNHLNQKRKDIEFDITDQALKILDSQQLEHHITIEKNYILIYHDNWHIGVLGIIAARLKEKFFKPVFVVSFDTHHTGSECIGSGSARAHDKSIHIGNILHKAQCKGVILSGGGHNMAGGFRLHHHQINMFAEFLDQELSHADIAKIPTYHIDMSCDISQLHSEFVERIKMLAPFGAAHHEPLIEIPEAIIVDIQQIGKDSLRFFIKSPLQGVKNYIKTLAFRHCHSDIGAAIYQAARDRSIVALLGYIKHDYWQGKVNLSFHLKDLRNKNSLQKADNE